MSNEGYEEFDEPTTVAELIGLIEEEKAAFLAAVDGLDEAKLSAPVGPEGWAIKDHIAHIVAWQDGISALLNGEPRWRAMGLSAPEELTTQDFDAVNAKIHALHAHKSTAEVRAMLEESHARMAATLRNMQDAELTRPYREFNPAAPAERGGKPIIGWISGNTFGHYREHRPWVEELAAQ